MHRMVNAVGWLTGVIMMLVAFPALSPSVAMNAKPEASGSVRLIEVDGPCLDAGCPSFDDLLAGGKIKVIARTGESVLLYATPGAAAVLEANGIGARLLMEDAVGSELYLIPMMDGLDIDALGAHHQILSVTGSHYLVAADPQASLDIQMLPFKQRLPDVWESGLPPSALRPSPVRGAAEPLTYDPAIQEMVDSVSQSRLYSILSGLSGENQVSIGGELYTINTRYSPTDMCKKAGQFILETFQGMGIEAEYDYFNWRTLMKAVHFPVDNQSGWAVGQQMSVLHTEDGGQVWIEDYTGDEGALNDIVMLDNTHGCIVGNNGIAMVTIDGSTWQRAYPPTSNNLNALCFVDAATAYCCGENGSILKSVDAGFSWTNLSSGTGSNLLGICFAGTGTGWVVGMDGVIRKTVDGGASWTSVSSPVGVDLYDVACKDEYTCWACGLSGTIVRTGDGATWEEVATPVSEDLKSVFFVNTLRGYACGKLGTMIKTVDGGTTWNDLNFPDNLNLNDLCFLSPGEGWVVGLGAVQHTTTGGLEWEDQRNGVRSGDVNVVATLPGTTDPEEIYIICGHYDSISQMPETYAPGADDNGTGTVGVIEAARVLKAHDFESTLRFVCFSREEQGLVGSGAYVREAKAHGDSIVAALNFDMIGYVDAAPEELDVIYNDISGWLADEYQAAAALYVPDLDIVKEYASYVGSDNSSFWNYNYPSFCGIEDSPLHNPYYHRTTDRVSTIDFDFYTDVVRAAVASLARLARLDTGSSSVAAAPEPAVFTVSPNPGRGEIAIEMTPSGRAADGFHIYSVEGKLVSTLSPVVSRGLVRATWDGSDFAGNAVGPGIYFVRVAGRDEGTKVVLLK